MDIIVGIPIREGTKNMLSREQISFFKNQGYLVLEGLVHQDKYLNPIRKEYSGLLDSLIDKWVAQGKIEALPLKYNFFDKISIT